MIRIVAEKVNNRGVIPWARTILSFSAIAESLLIKPILQRKMERSVDHGRGIERWADASLAPSVPWLSST